MESAEEKRGGGSGKVSAEDAFEERRRQHEQEEKDNKRTQELRRPRGASAVPSSVDCSFAERLKRKQEERINMPTIISSCSKDQENKTRLESGTGPLGSEGTTLSNRRNERHIQSKLPGGSQSIAKAIFEEKLQRKVLENKQKTDTTAASKDKARNLFSHLQLDEAFADLQRFQDGDTPRTLANTACHDARSHCIRLPVVADGGALLQGSIIEMDTPLSQPGKLLLGKIMQIVIMDEDMTPLAVYDEQNKSPPEQRNAQDVLHQRPQEKGRLLNENRERFYVEFEEGRETTDRPQQQSEEQRKEERRKKIQSVMKDHTLDRQEKQKQLSLIKSKYEPPSSAHAGNTGQGSGAAVFAASANTLSQNGGTSSRPSFQALNRDAVAKVTANAFASKPKPIGDFCLLLQTDAPFLTELALDGRNNISSSEWSELFGTLEHNTCLTQLSLVDCGLTDATLVPLVLALVENETLTSLNIARNPGVTKSTGKFLAKVLTQSNPVLKKLNIDGTAISAKTAAKLTDILADRDDVLKLAKMQEARQKKIAELLEFSASDTMELSSRRISERLLELDKDSNAKKKPSGGSSNKSKGSGTGGTRQQNMHKRVTLTSAVGAIAQGLCPDCGAKCFEKTMFKTRPLNVPGKVKDGRCLICT